MAEWSIAAVLKTVELRGSWGSNPYLSAELTGQNRSSKGQNPTNQWFVGFFVSTKSIPKDTKRTVKDKVLSPIRYHLVNPIYFFKNPLIYSEDSQKL